MNVGHFQPADYREKTTECQERLHLVALEVIWDVVVILSHPIIHSIQYLGLHYIVGENSVNSLLYLYSPEQSTQPASIEFDSKFLFSFSQSLE